MTKARSRIGYAALKMVLGMRDAHVAVTRCADAATHRPIAYGDPALLVGPISRNIECVGTFCGFFVLSLVEKRLRSHEICPMERSPGLLGEPARRRRRNAKLKRDQERADRQGLPGTWRRPVRRFRECHWSGLRSHGWAGFIPICARSATIESIPGTSRISSAIIESPSLQFHQWLKTVGWSSESWPERRWPPEMARDARGRRETYPNELRVLRVHALLLRCVNRGM
jgi:hypothetical protein